MFKNEKIKKIYGIFLILILGILLFQVLNKKEITIIQTHTTTQNLFPKNEIIGGHTPVNINRINDRVCISDVYEMDGETHKGNSMEPFIFGGNTLLLQHYKNQDLGIGDIIVFKYGDSKFLHRITNINGDSIETQGDNSQFGETILREDVLSILKCTCYT